MSLEPGSTFGPYRVIAPLGRGGMAVVVRALDPQLEREVALKVLPPELLHDPTFAERFRQEARVAARLEHPHILPVHGYGIDDGRPWMALRLVSGGSLADRLRLGPFAPSAAARVLAEVASALDYAHAHGVVHRDVKPANVLLDAAGHAYLADFGIARLAEGSAVVTATGVIQGTPAYMAPEQALGAKVDARADVYALGVMAFECLTGRVPYTGSTPVAVLMKHVSEPVPEPASSEVAPPLTPVLRRCLAKDPAERWPTAGSFAEALSDASRGLPDGIPQDLPTLVAEDEPTVARDPSPGPGAAAVPAGGDGRRRTSSRMALLLLAGALGLGVLVLALGWLTLRFFGGGPAPRAGSDLQQAPAAPAAMVARASAPPPSTPPSPPAAAVVRPTPTPESVHPTPTPESVRPTPTPESVRPTPASEPTTAAPPDAARTSPYDLASRYRGEPVRPGKPRVYCEPSLEPVMFRNTDAKDVSDSVRDLREALAKRGQVELVSSRDAAEAVVQVLERGREPARIGMRKVRVRVSMGGESVELLGQDGAASFNTWSGAAGGAARQIEAWLSRRR